MYRSGIIILVFVIYHLLHFTFRVTGPQTGMVELHGHGMVRDVYGMVVRGFSVWYIALAYIIAQLVLGVHLSHGVSAVFQTLGWRGPKYDHLIGLAGPIAAATIVVGNCSIPLAIFLGLVSYGR
jgi:succinate dehydrogenase / fumarate reductase cytochrome b subunit